MRKLLFFTFLCASTLMYSQTGEDYEKIISDIATAFNKDDVSTVHGMFTANLQSTLTLDQLKANFTDVKKHQGEMGEATLLVEDETGKSYLISFENGDMLLNLLLDSSKKIKIFELKEY